jgi:DNA-binding NarL/FixJ family response regulator
MALRGKKMDRQRQRSKEDYFEKPDVQLLSDRQWSYLQKRFHITNREIEVANLICRGFNNLEVAEKLNITPGTAKTHLRNLYKRVRVNSKIELLLRFVEDARIMEDHPQSRSAASA